LISPDPWQPSHLDPQGNNPTLIMKQFYVPVFTGQDLCLAVRDQAPFRLPTGGDCGSAFVQLQPVMPQTAMDVRAGETFFVLDVSLWGSCIQVWGASCAALRVIAGCNLSPLIW
jgi:hypothetical protein